MLVILQKIISYASYLLKKFHRFQKKIKFKHRKLLYKFQISINFYTSRVQQNFKLVDRSWLNSNLRKTRVNKYKFSECSFEIRLEPTY